MSISFFVIYLFIFTADEFWTVTMTPKTIQLKPLDWGYIATVQFLFLGTITSGALFSVKWFSEQKFQISILSKATAVLSSNIQEEFVLEVHHWSDSSKTAPSERPTLRTRL